MNDASDRLLNRVWEVSSYTRAQLRRMSNEVLCDVLAQYDLGPPSNTTVMMNEFLGVS